MAVKNQERKFNNRQKNPYFKHSFQNLHMKKKLLIVLSMITIVVLGIAATTAPQEHEHKNLKVLPKNISHEDLDKVMDDFNKALGVKCGFCHAQAAAPADGGKPKLNFASDEKDHKIIAREMMKMTTRVNKKFFHYQVGKSEGTQPVTCMTCHNGAVHPKK